MAGSWGSPWCGIGCGQRWCGPGRQNAIRTLLVTDEHGRFLFAGATRPGSCADITQARTAGLSVRGDGRAYPVLPVAFPPSGRLFNQAIYVPTGGLPVIGGALSARASVTAVATRTPIGVPQTAN